MQKSRRNAGSTKTMALIADLAPCARLLIARPHSSEHSQEWLCHESYSDANCVRDRMLPLGSLNHATFVPSGVVQIPKSS
jgi:hypothetical protein